MLLAYKRESEPGLFLSVLLNDRLHKVADDNYVPWLLLFLTLIKRHEPDLFADQAVGCFRNNFIFSNNLIFESLC